MREIGKIGRRMDTPEAKAFWKTIEQAAEEVRKMPEWMRSLPPQPPPAPIIQVETFEPTHKTLRERVIKKEKRRAELESKAHQLWNEESKLIKELQAKCTHEHCLEKRSRYTDEYDDWHDGNVWRKCINCYLTEEASYAMDDRMYNSGNRKYAKLAKSVVVDMRKTIDGKEFQFEYDDLKWSKT